MSVIEINIAFPNDRIPYRPIETVERMSFDLQASRCYHFFEIASFNDANMIWLFECFRRRQAFQNMLGSGIRDTEKIARTLLAYPEELAQNLCRIIDMLEHFGANNLVGGFGFNRQRGDCRRREDLWAAVDAGIADVARDSAFRPDGPAILHVQDRHPRGSNSGPIFSVLSLPRDLASCASSFSV